MNWHQLSIFWQVRTLLAAILLAFNGNVVLARQTASEISTQSVQDTSATWQISEIILHGNKKTKDRIIYRELAIKEGGTIAKKDIEKILQLEENKVVNTNLFNKEETYIEWTQIGNNAIVIDIYVSERWYIFPFPILEIAELDLQEWLALPNAEKFDWINYGINLKWRNFRGRKELIQFNAQNGFVRNFSGSYDVPFINKAQTIGFNVAGGYSEERQPTIGVEDGSTVSLDSLVTDIPEGRNWWQERAAVNFTYRKGFYDFHTLGIGVNQQTITRSVTAANDNYLAGSDTLQRALALSYNYTRDFRDFITYPLKGSFLSVQFIRSGFGALGDMNITTLGVNYSRFYDLGKAWYYSFAINGRSSISDRPLPYRNTIAHADNDGLTVRGFKGYQIQGESVAVIKNTLRWKALDNRINLKKLMPLEQFKIIPYKIYPKVFADFGYVQNNSTHLFPSPLANEPLLSAGIGFDLITFYNVVLQFEISLTNGLRLFPGSEELRAKRELNRLIEFSPSSDL